MAEAACGNLERAKDALNKADRALEMLEKNPPKWIGDAEEESGGAGGKGKSLEMFMKSQRGEVTTICNSVREYLDRGKGIISPHLLPPFPHFYGTALYKGRYIKKGRGKS